MMPIYIGLVYLVLCSSPFLDSFAKTCLWVTWDITIQRNSPHQSGLTETLRIPAIFLSFTMTPDIFLSSQQQWFISFRPEECTCLLVPLAIYFFWSDVSCSVGYFCAPPICITGIVSCSCALAGFTCIAAACSLVVCTLGECLSARSVFAVFLTLPDCISR